MNQAEIIKQINKGIKKANEYFVNNNIKAKAYDVVNVKVERKK